jgi:hypothetical protein
MKTAMQELIESYKNDSKANLTNEQRKLIEWAIYSTELYLEKEKEQIIDAHGLKYYDIGEVTITGENYYNQTYNKPIL